MSGTENRVVVVTGAGGGLGRTYALALAAGGAKVVVNDLGGSRDGSGAGSSMADAVVAEIRSAGGLAVANYDSVSTEAGAAAIVQTALDEFGTLDGLVSNAGILRDRVFHKLDADDWQAVQDVHLNGGYFVTRAAWPQFREQARGRVVFATSTSGIYGNFGQANYGAAKLGLVGLMNTLAIEGAKYDILVNAVAPIARTRMTEDLAPTEVLDKLDPEHVAPVVAHLMSDELQDSGGVYVVGGGQISRVQQFQNAGVTLDHVPTVAEVSKHWDAIRDMRGAVAGKTPIA